MSGHIQYFFFFFDFLCVLFAIVIITIIIIIIVVKFFAAPCWLIRNIPWESEKNITRNNQASKFDEW